MILLVLSLFLSLSSLEIGLTKQTVVVLDEQPEWVSLVNKTRMMVDIETLASDSYSGRYPGTEGEELTLNYISNELNKLNISTPTNRSDFRQIFHLNPWVKPISPINLVISGDSLSYEEDFCEFTYSGNVSIQNPTEIVFVGYGLSRDNYDDYNGLNVTGKIVLLSSNLPSGVTADDEYATGEKIKTAAFNGASGVLLVPHLYSTDELVKGVCLGMENFNPEIGMIFVKRSVLNQYGIPVDAWINELDGLISAGGVYKGSLSRFTGINCTLETTTNYEYNKEIANIVGVFEGTTDDKMIIISAHHDHLGESITGNIYNGADDDASGVAVVLEVARVLNEEIKKNNFNKTVIVALWSAEEMDHLGAQYYVNNPLFPLNDVDFVIEHDMVGVGPENGKLKVLSPRSFTIPLDMLGDIMSAAQEYGNIPQIQGGNTGRGDHEEFGQKGVNAVMFFWDSMETHLNYHTPQDTAEFINPNILEKVALTTLGYIIDYHNAPETSTTITTTPEQSTTTSEITDTTTTSATPSSELVFILPVVVLAFSISRIFRKKRGKKFF
ncbi:MAG: M20/M25/M40 family metallo-hydrolase [Candidatus Hodarchaeales archaeon]